MKADYGIDAPTVVRNMIVIAFALALISIVPAVRWMLYPAVSLLVTPLIMIWGSKVGKLRLRDRLLDELHLAGDEQVLDVGCGRGLLLIGAAKRLKTGKATGIDLWQTVDQSGNSRETTLENAQAEGVADKVLIETGDARQLPFVDASFDLILSSWALHNIPGAEGRQKAIEEIGRVLKPGGRVAIVDISCASEYEARMYVLGMSDIQLSGPNFLFVTPTRALTARKPA